MKNPLTTIQVNDITSLFVVIDDCLKRKVTKKTGRPSLLTESEILSIIVWCTLFLKFKCLKDMYYFIKHYHQNEFGYLGDYSSFVRYCHRVSPLMLEIIDQTLMKDSYIQFVDSTMVQVCHLVRANSHKTAKNVAAFGKNHQGWHYGFKLHATVNEQGHFCSIALTPANIHDAQMLPTLTRSKVRIIVGDGGYTASVMRQRLWKEKGIYIVSPPHPKQKTKLMTPWQHALLKTRPKVESAFDFLKQHLHLVTSFPRSVTGYLFHYLRVILAYQLRFLFN